MCPLRGVLRRPEVLQRGPYKSRDALGRIARCDERELVSRKIGQANVNAASAILNIVELAECMDNIAAMVTPKVRITGNLRPTHLPNTNKSSEPSEALTADTDRLVATLP